MKKSKMYYWYLSKDENGNIRLHGNVTGHYKYEDSTFINSSFVSNFFIKGNELLVETQNSLYKCPLSFCNIKKQESTHNEFFDENEWNQILAQTNYKTEITCDENEILLVISNYDDYYFNDLIAYNNGKKIQYEVFPHIGTFQDSFLITNYEDDIDIRYFPHPGNLEFYSECFGNREFLIENIGDNELFAQTSVGVIKIEPNQRKAIIKENIIKEEKYLTGGDLYPAGFIDLNDQK